MVLRGKVDGLSDGTIIESKNRTRKLFQEIREYEQVQLEGYILTGFTKALLTEHFNDTECCVLEYTHDRLFWEKCKN